MRKPSLIAYVYVRLITASIGGLLVLAAAWGWAEYHDFIGHAQSLRDAQRERSEIFLKRMVEDVSTMIDFERRGTEARVESVLKRRIDDAEAVALNLLKTQSAGRSRGELESLIREAWRPIRFNSGRGYLFAFDLNGTEQLFAARPELEGKNMLDLTGARGELVVHDMLAAAQRGGDVFYRYFWTQPGKPGDEHLKIAHVRLIKPLGWVVGTGEYVEDMEADIKAEVLTRTENMHFNQNGYVFISRWDGEGLVGALKGKNPLRDGPDYLRDGTERLIRTAKAGGGFVEYHMPAGKDGELVGKVSYVVGFADWQWLIGAGIVNDETEAVLDLQRGELLKGLAFKAGLGVLIALLLAVLGIWVLHSTTNRAKRDAETLERELADAALSPHPVALDALRFREHDQFGQAANRLILRRVEAEQEVRERTLQLERTNADLERFAYVAAHDLQEPLRTVGLFLQLLQRRAVGKLSPEENEYIDFAVGGADRMRRNIQGLLAYCRSASHQDERETVEVDEILDQVLVDLQGAIYKNGAQIKRSALPRLRVIPDQITALLQNLIGNALRYRKPEIAPQITISAELNLDGMWEFAVSDNGIGVPREFRTAIFEPFRRFNNPGAESGSGIGLALCRRVVESHGGRIWIDSSASGSAFRFTLPQTDETA